MNNVHYHVLQGLRGCYMPNSNDACSTQESARRGARARAQWARSDGERVRKVSEDYYAVGQHECIEVTECTEDGCLEEES